MQRQPFFSSAVEILKLSDSGEIESFISSNSITYIFYVLRKFFHDIDDRKQAVRHIMQIVNIVSVTKTDIFKSFELNFTDFEDALQTQCAKKIKADFIVIRNEKDFRDPTINVISPEKFISEVNGN